MLDKRTHFPTDITYRSFVIVVEPVGKHFKATARKIGSRFDHPDDCVYTQVPHRTAEDAIEAVKRGIDQVYAGLEAIAPPKGGGASRFRPKGGRIHSGHTNIDPNPGERR